MVIFHVFLYVYQRVCQTWHTPHLQLVPHLIRQLHQEPALACNGIHTSCGLPFLLDPSVASNVWDTLPIWWFNGDSMVIQWDLLGYMMDIPSGKHSHGYWKWPFSSWIYPLKIVILHCYVSLPEGMGYIDISHRWRFIDETFIHKSAFFFS
jgi:hypothetical protein